MDAMTQLHLLGEVALAMLLGGVIGMEREHADKPAGFRTHMLVAGAAALLVGLGDALLYSYRLESAVPISSDPIRIVQAIVTGISFLGAGTIFRRTGGNGVEGITTAASLLLSGAIGIAVALDQLVLAIGAVLLTLAVLKGLAKMEQKFGRPR
jgi:putative Mg2+ transporter-C (MgtC) family protein